MIGPSDNIGVLYIYIYIYIYCFNLYFSLVTDPAQYLCLDIINIFTHFILLQHRKFHSKELSIFITN